MFFLRTIQSWLRNRGRLLFRYHDGERWRRADPLVVGRALESNEPEYATLLTVLHDPPEKLPPGTIKTELIKQQTDAAHRLTKLARTVFGLPVLTETGGATDGEALGVLTAYFLFMEDLAEAAGFTSTPPAVGSSPPAASPIGP